MDFHSSNARADVVVVGAGIAGASTAFWLARMGYKSLVVERLGAPAAATTSASAHSVRAQFDERENILMMRESLDIYGAFAETLGMEPDYADIGFQRGGYLFASTDPEAPALIQARVAFQQTQGLDDVEALPPDEVRRRFPWMDPAVTAASYRARDGWIDGVRATELFLEASGATVLYETETLEIVTRADRVTGVDTTQGIINTDAVVLAAGPFTTIVAKEWLPLQMVRRHRLILDRRPEVPAEAPMTVDADTGAHWRPHRGGALLAWARPEPAGPPVWPVPPDPNFPAMVLRDRDGVGRLAPFWRDLVPDITPAELYLTAAQYEITPDHLPIIGPAAETEGLWIHTGYSGHGIMGSPSGGRLLAELMTGQRCAGDNPFRLERFAESSRPLDNERMVL